VFRIPDSLKTEIKDPLLKCAVEGTPHGLSHLPDVLSSQSWNVGKLTFGHVYLTFITRKVFNIHRFPGYGERAFSSRHIPSWTQELIKRVFENLKDEDVERSTEELKRIREFTQKTLREAGYGEKIKLYRELSLDYAAIYYFLKNYLRENPGCCIVVETDILDSYALGNGYVKDVMIVREIPLEDVLFCNLTVTSLKEDEWIVMNRDPRGFVILTEENIVTNHNEYRICILKNHIRKREKYFVSLARKALKPLSEREFKYEETRLNFFDVCKTPEVENTRLVKLAKFISGK